MIYIFNFVKEICSLPGRLCMECGKIFEYCNCKICTDCCESLGNCCRGFLDKPLSSYVILTWLLSLGELALCASAFSADALKGCRGTSHALGVGVHSWLVIQMGFALLNLLFAPYFQGRVWQNLLETVQSSGAATRGKIGKEVVQGSFKHVFLHDFGVLFYFLALMASFLWSVNGSNWQNHMYCNPDGATANAAFLGMSLFWVAVFYSVMWYWCSCCAKSVDPAALRSDLEKQPVPAYPVGGGGGGAASASQALYQGGGQSRTQGNLSQPPAGQYMPVAQGVVVQSKR